MNSIQTLIATSACLGAVMLATTAGAAPAGSEMGRETATGGGPHHGGAFHHARRDRGRHGRGFGHICGKRREARTERMISVVEGLMTFNAKQEAAWKDLTNAVRDSNKSMDATCDSLKQAKDEPTNAAQRLARMETMLAAGLKFIRTVRPKFDRFYATLNDKQKKAFDSLARHRRMR